MNARGLARNRWVLGSVGFIAFSLVAWSVGDLVVLGAWRPFETEGGRTALIAIAGAAWIGSELRRLLRARDENKRLLEMLASGDGEGAASESAARAAHEISVLRKRFEAAAEILKKARFKGPDGEHRYVHELPWYVFIGAPGSGKTTALVNSGLRFPLREAGLAGAGEDPALAGVGGTRNCDWWFTDEAVLLDTAGRYTTQESDLEADAAAWQGFLDLIKRFRPRRPLNGALVTLSVSDLMLWSEEERRKYAWHVRARVAELYERLGVRFPIYLLVTKADLLAGFMEFFGELDADARKRVWGATFGVPGESHSAGTPGQRFAGELAELERRLYAEMLTRMQGERDLQRRAAAYRFPQEFHGVGPLIEQFLDSAFMVAPGAPEPMLRGVYFTSGTQEGNPIDRVLGALARSFGLERAGTPLVATSSGKSFFLTRLVREVIFPESGLAGSDRGHEQRERRARTIAYAAIAATGVALSALWTVNYLANHDLVALTHAKAAAAKAELEKLGPPHLGDESQLVRALNALRDLPGGYRQQAEGAVSVGFGLSQSQKLGAQALRAYRNALRDVLEPRLAAAKNDASNWPLSEAERADLADHVRAITDEAIITNARRKPAPAKAS